MNAYELADKLVNTPYEPIKADCASMLRQLHCENIELGDQYARLEVKNKQQADRIAELEETIAILRDRICEMNEAQDYRD